MTMYSLVQAIVKRQEELWENGEIRRKISCLELIKILYLVHRECVGKFGFPLIEGDLEYSVVKQHGYIMHNPTLFIYGRDGAVDIDSCLDGNVFNFLQDEGFKKPKELIDIMDKYITKSYWEISSLCSESIIVKNNVPKEMIDECLIMEDWNEFKMSYSE